jgi:predicted  nucleic acid-binding Zn-ribbon protein
LEPYDILKELVELQRLDSGLDDLEKHKKKFLNDIAALDANVKASQNQLQSEKKKLEELVKQRKTLEIETGTLDSHIAKYIKQQNDVKNSEQVTALGQEIEKSKLAKAQAEDKMMEILLQEDEQKIVIKTTTQTLSDEEKKAVEDKAYAQTKINDCDKAIEDKKQERAAQLAKVEAPYDRGYENIRNKGKKIAVAQVSEDNMCGGCNMNVAPQVLHDIRKKDAIINCQCGRYLYIKEYA